MRILLAVSGGIDSMYLANRALEHTDTLFAVAHCNFSLRGEESDADEAFVRSWAEKHGVRLFVKRFDTRAYASQHGVSIEMAARELRYSWFSCLCRGEEPGCPEGFDAVAVAHNANDNAETLFLNLLRGTGSRGLRGMSPRSTTEDGMVVLRPLLDLSRASIAEWMKAHGCEWREDSTNIENDCKRNKLRNQVFPILEEINPSFLKTLNADMKRFAQVDWIAQSCFEKACEALGVDPAAKENRADIDVLVGLEHWKYLLWRLVEPCHLNAETFNKLTELLERYKSSPSGTVTVSGKVFESAGGRVSFNRKTMLITNE